MSKITVKKALASLDRDQLQALLLQLYSARKEAKEYLDFFAEPDIESLTNEYRDNIAKALTKRSRKHAKPSITTVRRLMRYYISLDPGAEYVVSLMLFTLGEIYKLFQTCWLSEAQEKSLTNYLNDVVKYADQNGMWTEMASKVSIMAQSLSNSQFADARRVGHQWHEILAQYTPTLLPTAHTPTKKG